MKRPHSANNKISALLKVRCRVFAVGVLEHVTERMGAGAGPDYQNL